MAPTESQLAAAEDELIKDRREFFCIECGRPRAKKYCPWNAKHKDQRPHTVLTRSNISRSSQLNLFLSNQHGDSTRHVFVED